MGGKRPFLRHAVAELRRRHVFSTVAAYVVAGWLLLQVADATFEPLGLPAWAQRALILAVIAGFPVACVLAWFFDVSGWTIRRTAAAAAPAEGADEARRTTPPEASVAILPFTDLSQAQDQDWFCDGLSEEIIDALCCVRGLRVASRTASFRYRDGSVDPRTIGRELGVGAILEGSVRRQDERLRISVQLVDADSGYHLWSEAYDRRMADVFAIQGEIARSVARALKLSLTGPAAEQRGRFAPRNLEAYEYYLRGRQLVGQTTSTAWQHAPTLFRNSIEKDPEFAQAHAGLADILAQAVLWRFARREDVLPEATAASRRALELAPNLAEAHVAHGHVLSLAGQNEAATRAFERALELNPALHEANLYFARHLYALGDFARAAACFEAAFRARPDDHSVLALAVNAFESAGQRQRADAVARTALDGLEHQLKLEPENSRLHALAGQLHLRQGDAEAGRRHVETALRLRPDDFSTRYNAACFYSQSGELERALDLLEQQAAGSAGWMAHDSDLAPLRGHPRFEALLARLGDDAA